MQLLVDREEVPEVAQLDCGLLPRAHVATARMGRPSIDRGSKRRCTGSLFW
jgi:hypothetical protein